MRIWRKKGSDILLSSCTFGMQNKLKTNLGVVMAEDYDLMESKTDEFNVS